MPASCHPRSCLWVGRVCWAAWVQLFLCLCFCKPCCARAVFIIHDASELLDLSFLTKAWKGPMQFLCRHPQVQSFLQTGVIMWLLLLHHRLAQGGDSSCPRQHSVIYATRVWFAHKTGFQRLVNCQSKSSPCSLWCPLVCSSLRVLCGFVVLFKSMLFHRISFPFSKPGWKHFLVNITEVFYCSSGGDYKTTTFWLTNAINVMKIPLCFTFHFITCYRNMLNTSVWRTALHKGKMYFPWRFLELLWEMAIFACFSLLPCLSLHFPVS